MISNSNADISKESDFAFPPLRINPVAEALPTQKPQNTSSRWQRQRAALATNPSLLRSTPQAPAMPGPIRTLQSPTTQSLTFISSTSQAPANRNKISREQQIALTPKIPHSRSPIANRPPDARIRIAANQQENTYEDRHHFSKKQNRFSRSQEQGSERDKREQVMKS